MNAKEKVCVHHGCTELPSYKRCGGHQTAHRLSVNYAVDGMVNV